MAILYQTISLKLTRTCEVNVYLSPHGGLHCKTSLLIEYF